jgi:hypothetical protein
MTVYEADLKEGPISQKLGIEIQYGPALSQRGAEISSAQIIVGRREVFLRFPALRRVQATGQQAG